MSDVFAQIQSGGIKLRSASAAAATPAAGGAGASGAGAPSSSSSSAAPSQAVPAAGLGAGGGAAGGGMGGVLGAIKAGSFHLRSRWVAPGGLSLGGQRVSWLLLLL